MLNILYTTYFIVLLAVLVASGFHIKQKICKYLFVLFSLSIVTELFALSKNFEIYIYYAVFTPVECILVSLLLTTHLPRSYLQPLIKSVLILFTIICVAWIVINHSDYPAQLTAIEDLILVGCCLLSFYFIDPLPDITVTRRSIFWITLGFFIYFMETFAVNTMYNTWQIAEPTRAKEIHKYVNVLINIICYLLLGYGITINRWEAKFT